MLISLPTSMSFKFYRHERVWFMLQRSYYRNFKINIFHKISWTRWWVSLVSLYTIYYIIQDMFYVITGVRENIQYLVFCLDEQLKSSDYIYLWRKCSHLNNSLVHDNFIYYSLSSCLKPLFIQLNWSISTFTSASTMH